MIKDKKEEEIFDIEMWNVDDDNNKRTYQYEGKILNDTWQQDDDESTCQLFSDHFITKKMNLLS
jgi:hypothetical protein